MAVVLSNGAIAATLVISERAVEKHVANIFCSSAWRRRSPTTTGSSPSSATCSPAVAGGRRWRAAAGQPRVSLR